MANAQLRPILNHVSRLLLAQRTHELSDEQLLQIFTQERNEDAFAVLVEQHGRLVMRVCRHVLHHAQDAEDAFQATFLVLACKARSIRKREALASWLHGVAYRMSLKAKRNAARKQPRAGLPGPLAIDAAAEPTWREVQAILAEEIEQLPEKYRVPFILCYLDGLSRTQVALQLGIKEGTVSSRLAGAKARLQKRLQLRGVTLSAVLAGLAGCFDRLVGGHDDTDVVPQSGQRLGQRPADVGQPAGLGEGGHLGAEHEDLQPLHVASPGVSAAASPPSYFLGPTEA